MQNNSMGQETFINNDKELGLKTQHDVYGSHFEYSFRLMAQCPKSDG